jgi:outer membrane protein, multidrug efflux system
VSASTEQLFVRGREFRVRTQGDCGKRGRGQGPGRGPFGRIAAARGTAGLPLQLLERRPDVLAAEHSFDAAFHLVHTARAARLPAISLTAASGYMTNHILQTLRMRPVMWTAAANLWAPLYTGGYLNAQVKIANENQKAALMMYGQTVLNAFNEVEVNLNNEVFLKDQQQELETGLKATEDVLAIMKVKREVGEIDIQPVLQAEAAVLGVKTGVTGVQLARLTTRINPQLALGGAF